MNEALDRILLCRSPNIFLILTFICGGITIFLIQGGTKNVKPPNLKIIPDLIKRNTNEVEYKHAFKSPNVIKEFKACQRMNLNTNILQPSISASFGNGRLANQLCNFASGYAIWRQYGILNI